MSDNNLKRNLNFADAIDPFVKRGNFPQHQLVPLIPFGAKISAASKIKPAQIGKIPGRYISTTQEWCGLTNWTIEDIPAATLRQYELWPTNNVGLRSTMFPGVDIDIEDKQVVDFILNLANIRLGSAPIRRRANSPRALLVYKLDGTAFRKKRLDLTAPDGGLHAIEVLGQGQQYAINGTHPSGFDYEWEEFADLVTFGANGLVAVNASDFDNFLKEAATELEKLGWKVSGFTDQPSSASLTNSHLKDLEPAYSTELALAALRSIPNTQDIIPDHQEFVGLLSSFKAAVGRNALLPDVKDAVREWATEYGWADDDYFEARWSSLINIRSGPDRLFRMAREFGFRDDIREDFKDTVLVEQKITEAISMRDAEEQALYDVADKLVYWADKQTWIVRATGVQLKPREMNNHPDFGCKIAPAGTEGTKSASALILNANIVKTVSGITYLPGQPELVTDSFTGRPVLYFNRWRKHHVDTPDHVSDDDVKLWLDHVHHLVPDNDDRNMLLDFMAHIAQHPGIKIRFAIIFIGNQGTGKDLLFRPLVKALGPANSAQTQAYRAMEKFADFYERELVLIEEISRAERTDVYEHMKAIISGTASDTITIERKMQQPYDIPNIVNLVFFSNHEDALNLSEDDRRFYVISSPAAHKNDAYYSALADGFYKEKKGWKAVYQWLLQRDLSQFNPNARPKSNEAKAAMIEDAMPLPIRSVRDALIDGVFSNRTVMTSQDLSAEVQLNGAFDKTVKDRFSTASQVGRAFKAAGWVQARQIREDKKTIRLWCRTKEIADSSNEMLLARYSSEKTSTKKFSHSA